MHSLLLFCAVAAFSTFSVATALKCYHCISADVAVGTKSLCDDPDSMKTTDCGDSSNYVHTEYGYVPKDVALVMGFTGAPAAINNIDFRCMKYTTTDSKEIGGAEVKYEIVARSCLADIPGEHATLWDICEKDGDCYLCDSDGCNAASTIAYSMIFFILGLIVTYCNV